MTSPDGSVHRQSGEVWLYGRGIDLLLGSGLAYLLTVPLFAVAILQVDSVAMQVLTISIGLLIAGPHYGATLLRVYETRAARRRYTFFSVYATILILGLTVLGARNLLVGSLLLTLYVTWSPWHFAGQNYGITLLQLRRQGVGIEASDKRLIYTSYGLSFLLVFLVTHLGHAKQSDASFRLPPYLVKATLAGAAISGVPALVLAPGALGRVPFDAGLALLVFSVVNLHHFVLDGAIWKLRDGQVARALLRAERSVPEPIQPTRSWVRGLVWASGLVCMAVMVLSALEMRSLHDLDAAGGPDLARAKVALNRLRWLGRDSSWNRLVIGSKWAARGQHVKADEAFGQSIAIRPTSEAWFRKAELHQKDHNWSAAMAAYDQALVLAPGDTRILQRRRNIHRKLAPGAVRRRG